MKGSTLNIEVTRANELNSHGISEFHFLAETNPGEGFFVLKKLLLVVSYQEFFWR